MPTRRMLVWSGVLTAVIAAMLPLKVVAGADGGLDVALSTVAAQEGNGNAGGNGGGNGNEGSGGNGSDNAGGGNSGNNGNGSGSDNSGGNGNGNGGTGTGSGSAPAGGAANPGSAPATPATPAQPATPATPAAPSKAGVEVDMRGSSITVRHQNGTTERISQGRYEMRDSRSRTIVNRTATPSDASRLRSFGR